MILHFAQISQQDEGPFLIVVIGLSALLFIANQALTFYKEHVREKPVPAETYATKGEHADLEQKVEECATKVELEDVKKRVEKTSTAVELERMEENLKGEIGRVERTLTADLTKQASSRKDMHKEIGDLQADVQGLKTTGDHHGQRLHVMDGKIDRILERLSRK